MEFDADPTVPLPRFAPTEIAHKKGLRFQPPAEEPHLLEEQQTNMDRAYHAYQIAYLREYKATMPLRIQSKETEIAAMQTEALDALRSLYETTPPLEEGAKATAITEATERFHAKHSALRTELLTTARAKRLTKVKKREDAERAKLKELSQRRDNSPDNSPDNSLSAAKRDAGAMLPHVVVDTTVRTLSRRSDDLLPRHRERAASPGGAAADLVRAEPAAGVQEKPLLEGDDRSLDSLRECARPGELAWAERQGRDRIRPAAGRPGWQ